MEVKEKTLLRLHGVGEIPTEFASAVLTRMHTAYDGLRILEGLGNLMESDTHKARSIIASGIFGVIGEGAFAHLYEPLELRGVVLQSPGFWEFFGKLNPLESIRIYLNDRHERVKDKNYRNKYDAERLSIENNLMKLQLIDKAVDAAKKAGLSEQEISSMIRDHALVPLLRLESLQDKNIISYAEIPKKEKSEIAVPENN